MIATGNGSANCRLKRIKGRKINVVRSRSHEPTNCCNKFIDEKWWMDRFKLRSSRSPRAAEEARGLH